MMAIGALHLLVRITVRRRPPCRRPPAVRRGRDRAEPFRVHLKPRVEPRRAQFLEMFARAYFPGRTGQIMIVPREGDIITRRDPDVPYMHGSPWGTTSRFRCSLPAPASGRESIPRPPGNRTWRSRSPRRSARTMPPTSTGRPLPVLNPRAPRAARGGADRARRDAGRLLRSLRRRDAGALEIAPRGAWFTRARLNYLPSNTAVGHSTISTGTDPRVHGITGNNLYDRVNRKRRDSFEGWRLRT